MRTYYPLGGGHWRGCRPSSHLAYLQAQQVRPQSVPPSVYPSFPFDLVPPRLYRSFGPMLDPLSYFEDSLFRISFAASLRPPPS